MAEQKGLKEDPVITRLVPDPAAPPDVIAMVGFLGKSTRPRFWRVYRTLDLKDYTEIAEDDIVQTESLKSEQQPLGGTVIWVKSGARLQNSRSESSVAEADFMHGEITTKFLGSTGTEGLARTGGSVGDVLKYNTYYPCTKYFCVAFGTRGPCHID